MITRAAAPLTGFGVALEPLRAEHAAELAGIADDVLWRYSPQQPGPRPATPEQHRAWIDTWLKAALAAANEGREAVFGVRRVADGALVGSSRYLNVAWPHKRVEIGGTFYAPAARRTAINTACKLLLLRRAFDELGCVRVELKCDARNDASRTAILRLGAIEEGTLRRHLVLGDGFIRDTVYFSVLDAEWPAVRERLESRLGVR